MAENCLVMTGTVCRQPRQKVSPAGIPHTFFTMEHRSQQLEAGYTRPVYCRIQVVVSGEQMQPQARALIQGSNIKAGGYLVWQEDRNGLSKLVLHAHSIELMN